MTIEVRFSDPRLEADNHLIRQRCLGKISAYNVVNEKSPIKEVILHRQENEAGQAAWIGFLPVQGFQLTAVEDVTKTTNCILAEHKETQKADILLLHVGKGKWLLDSETEADISKYQQIGSYLFYVEGIN